MVGFEIKVGTQEYQKKLPKYSNLHYEFDRDQILTKLNKSCRNQTFYPVVKEMPNNTKIQILTEKYAILIEK